MSPCHNIKENDQPCQHVKSSQLCPLNLPICRQLSNWQKDTCVTTRRHMSNMSKHVTMSTLSTMLKHCHTPRFGYMCRCEHACKGDVDACIGGCVCNGWVHWFGVDNCDGHWHAWMVATKCVYTMCGYTTSERGMSVCSHWTVHVVMTWSVWLFLVNVSCNTNVWATIHVVVGRRFRVDVCSNHATHMCP